MQDYFWKVFHKYYNLICIFICTPICTKNCILAKSGCYSLSAVTRFSGGGGMVRGSPEQTIGKVVGLECLVWVADAPWWADLEDGAGARQVDGGAGCD
jgi:hypothetical protein